MCEEIFECCECCECCDVVEEMEGVDVGDSGFPQSSEAPPFMDMERGFEALEPSNGTITDTADQILMLEGNKDNLTVEAYNDQLSKILDSMNGGPPTEGCEVLEGANLGDSELTQSTEAPAFEDMEQGLEMLGPSNGTVVDSANQIMELEANRDNLTVEEYNDQLAKIFESMQGDPSVATESPVTAEPPMPSADDAMPPEDSTQGIAATEAEPEPSREAEMEPTTETNGETEVEPEEPKPETMYYEIDPAYYEEEEITTGAKKGAASGLPSSKKKKKKTKSNDKKPKSDRSKTKKPKSGRSDGKPKSSHDGANLCENEEPAIIIDRKKKKTGKNERKENESNKFVEMAIDGVVDHLADAISIDDIVETATDIVSLAKDYQKPKSNRSEGNSKSDKKPKSNRSTGKPKSDRSKGKPKSDKQAKSEQSGEKPKLDRSEKNQVGTNLCETEKTVLIYDKKKKKKKKKKTNKLIEKAIDKAIDEAIDYLSDSSSSSDFDAITDILPMVQKLVV